jgi:hypothetical protein
LKGSGSLVGRVSGIGYKEETRCGEGAGGLEGLIGGKQLEREYQRVTQGAMLILK